MNIDHNRANEAGSTQEPSRQACSIPVDNQPVGKVPATRMVLEQDSNSGKGARKSPVITDLTLGWWEVGECRKSLDLRIQAKAQSSELTETGN